MVVNYNVVRTRGQNIVPKRAVLESVVHHHWHIAADRPHLPVAVLGVLHDGGGPTCKFVWKGLVDQFDGSDDAFVEWLSILVGNLLEDTQCLLDSVALCPSRGFGELPRVVVAILRTRNTV